MSDKLNLLIIERLTTHLSALIGECLDENGEPKPPNRKAIMRARAALPERFAYSLVRKKSTER